MDSNLYGLLPIISEVKRVTINLIKREMSHLTIGPTLLLSPYSSEFPRVDVISLGRQMITWPLIVCLLLARTAPDWRSFV